jgi:hypothetical protein
MISGDGQRLIQLGETGSHDPSNIACFRSEIREREERAMRKPEEKELTATQRAGQYFGELWKQEQRQKAAERAMKIRTGRIVLNKDGSETEQL